MPRRLKACHGNVTSERLYVIPVQSPYCTEWKSAVQSMLGGNPFINMKLRLKSKYNYKI